MSAENGRPAYIDGTFTAPPPGLVRITVGPSEIRTGDYMVDDSASPLAGDHGEPVPLIYWQALADAEIVTAAVGWAFVTFPVAFVDGARAWLQYGTLATVEIDVLREG